MPARIHVPVAGASAAADRGGYPYFEAWSATSFLMTFPPFMTNLTR